MINERLQRKGKESNSELTGQCFKTAHPCCETCTKFSLWQPVRMTTRLYQDRMHIMKHEPLRSLSFPQPSSKNHFPTNDCATFDFRQNISLHKGEPIKGITALLNLVKSSTMASENQNQALQMIIEHLSRRNLWPAFGSLNNMQRRKTKTTVKPSGARSRNGNSSDLIEYVI